MMEQLFWGIITIVSVVGGVALVAYLTNRYFEGLHDSCNEEDLAWLLLIEEMED